MENKNQLWKSGVKKAFQGFAGSVLFRLLACVNAGILTVTLMSAGGSSALQIFSVISLILLIISSLFFIYHFLGIKSMKDAAVGTLYNNGADKLYKGSLCLLIASFVAIIPVVGAVSAILNIVGYIFMFMAFDAMRKLELDELTAKGAKQLWLVAILSIVANVLVMVPFVGIVLNIVILIYAFNGWKNFSNSTLFSLEGTMCVSGNTAEEVESESQSQDKEECEQPQTEEEYENYQEKQRSFLLNRWIAKLARWFDGSVFNFVGDKRSSDSSWLCIWALWIGIIVGASIAVVEIINDESTFSNLAVSIGAGLILILVVIKAVKDAKKLETAGQIVGRVAYLILLPFVLAFIGGIIAAVAVVIVAIVLFLWLLLTMLFGTNEKVRLSNNDVVRNDGLIGGYRGKSGRRYSKNLDGTYTPED